MDTHTYQLLKFRVWRALPQALPYVFLAAVALALVLHYGVEKKKRGEGWSRKTMVCLAAAMAAWVAGVCLEHGVFGGLVRVLCLALVTAAILAAVRRIKKR